MKETKKHEKATFAAGCFWGVEDSFRQMKGVISTRVGYTGGETKDPSYHEVCTDTTGHAEAVEVTFNPKEIGYETLARHFFKMHDPTQVNRQGPDHGTQYRSAIFYHSTEQKKIAEKVKANIQKTISKPIATGIMPEAPFYRAEEYHQQYLAKKGLKVCH